MSLIHKFATFRAFARQAGWFWISTRKLWNSLRVIPPVGTGSAESVARS